MITCPDLVSMPNGCTIIIDQDSDWRLSVNKSAVPAGIITFSVEWYEEHPLISSIPWTGYLYSDFESALAAYLNSLPEKQLSFF